MLQEKIKLINKDFSFEIKSIKDAKQLDDLRVKYFSKNGLVPSLFALLKEATSKEKPLLGKILNEFRTDLQNQFDNVNSQLNDIKNTNLNKLDLTLPGVISNIGSKHILTQTLDEIKFIFKGMGFSVHEGPELESDYNNFEALNFAQDHPARDMQDTFFVSDDFVLRTHTSPVQIRLMKKQKPPVRAIMPGRVYRNEAVSSRSYCMFHQVEGLYVDTDVTFAELKGTLASFAKQFYGDDLKFRFRPSFFPFTEPSAEMDITCFICKGDGCKICKQSGWLEILGCGMVDPNVFDNVGYDNEKYTGYAFGMGIERIAMLKFGITDIRVFFENDYRFLKQF
ncbi:MAG: phenylalanine--tRNA ligase subunit alpha [Ignavibacteriales bacterium CG_4_9_14_3_um_filter_30_11]|nr:MAG: phenylalanine--tRNA ligase subunit alpha [Ignavibacteriales bacterium CG_4_9_14_3_um_filter_30_11]